MDAMPKWADVVLIPLISILIAFLISGLVILAIGEDPIMAIGPAVVNAVYDAVGVRFREIPLTPEKVLRALREKEVKKIETGEA